MELLDPAGGYLSVWRIAELADLPSHLIAPRDDYSRRRRFRLDTVERVLRVLRTAHILVFTKQQREELEDGRHTSTAPALRKLSVSFFLKWGGELAKEFKKRRDYLRVRAERRARRAFAAGVGVDLGISRDLRRLNNAKPESSVTASTEIAQQSYRQGESTIPIELTDATFPVRASSRAVPVSIAPRTLRERGRRRQQSSRGQSAMPDAYSFTSRRTLSRSPSRILSFGLLPSSAKMDVLSQTRAAAAADRVSPSFGGARSLTIS